MDYASYKVIEHLARKVGKSVPEMILALATISATRMLEEEAQANS
jgi:hypothetical protein